MEEYVWIGNVAMLCPVIYRNTASGKAIELSGGDINDPRNFFSREVGFKNTQEVVYYLAHSAIRDIVFNTLPTLEKAFPGSLWYMTLNKNDTEE